MGVIGCHSAPGVRTEALFGLLELIQFVVEVFEVDFGVGVFDFLAEVREGLPVVGDDFAVFELDYEVLDAEHLFERFSEVWLESD